MQHHHKKEMNGDSIEFSQQSLQATDKVAQGTQNNNNPLTSLVTSGVITQDQENSIKNAFDIARKDNDSNVDNTNEESTNS